MLNFDSKLDNVNCVNSSEMSQKVVCIIFHNYLYECKVTFSASWTDLFSTVIYCYFLTKYVVFAATTKKKKNERQLLVPFFPSFTT